jgi:hypothetical protein
MKAFLLTTAALMACVGSMFAQNLPPDYNWEFGVNGGLSGFTRPLGPDRAYQGSRTNIVPDFSLRLNYLASPHWMLNLDIGSRKWQTAGTWTPNDPQGVTLKPRDVTFLVADHAITENVGINYVIPFYTRYNNFNSTNINFGVTVGLVTTTNDGSLGYSKYGTAPDPNYPYLSRYDYGYGIGYSYGAQMGITYYIVPRLGVNLDAAMRYVNVGTTDEHYGSENNHFYLLYFPVTIGLRWRF